MINKYNLCVIACFAIASTGTAAAQAVSVSTMLYAWPPAGSVSPQCSRLLTPTAVIAASLLDTAVSSAATDTTAALLRTSRPSMHLLKDSKTQPGK